MSSKNLRWLVFLAAALALLAGAGFGAFQYAIHALKQRVERTLGPQGEVDDIRVSLNGVEVRGLHIKAPPVDKDAAGRAGAWPAGDQLRAERIVLMPSVMDLFSGKAMVKSIRVENAYIAMLRDRDGRIRVLPGLLAGQARARNAQRHTSQEAPAQADAAGLSAPRLHVGRLELVNCAIEFFDASVRTPPHKLRLEQINAAVEQLNLPDLTGVSQIDLVGVVKGVRQDGKISLSGTAELATRESGLTTRLRGVDLVALQPYLLKAAPATVSRGRFDLDLNSAVRQGILHAPGTLTLSDLELSGASTLMGLPRNVLLGAMKNREGKITLKFVLEGNINDPKFSLNEDLAKRLSAALAEALGLNIGGLAKSVGNIEGGIAKGIGESVRKLIGK